VEEGWKSGPLALGRERWEQTPSSLRRRARGTRRALRAGIEVGWRPRAQPYPCGTAAPGCAWWKSGASAPRKDDRESPFPCAAEPESSDFARWDGGGMEAPCAAISVWHSRPRLCLVEERRFSAAKKLIENPLPCAAGPRAAQRSDHKSPA
jgi:hypothetical protein